MSDIHSFKESLLYTIRRALIDEFRMQRPLFNRMSNTPWLMYLGQLFVCFLFSTTLHAKDTIIYPKQQDITSHQNSYFYQLMDLVLSKTVNEFGEYELKPSIQDIPQKRAVLMLSENKRIDLMWTMTSKEREQMLQAVYFPLLKGLLGHRIFIIRTSDQEKFKNIHSFDQLKTLLSGQGLGWPDVNILRHNGIKVIESPDYQNLFDMLRAERFDYFPRGITEAWGEHKNLNDDSLMVEQHLLFRYKAPLYFFVNKENHRLHDRLLRGLTLALEDGSFDELFYRESNIRQSIQQTDIKGRLVFDLENPDVLETKIFENSALWLSNVDTSFE